jgi:F-type H+-transporting ATPase subunit b
MKRLALSLLLTAGPILAQEGETQTNGPSPTTTMILLWVNFAILFFGLAWLMRKFGSPFLAARSGKIQRDLAEAAERRQAADARAAEVDRRLANLDSAIAEIRAESQKEIEVQRKRIAELTAAEMSKIRANVEQEVAAAGKGARAHLKSYTAQLAIQLAEQKIQSRITPDAEDRLLQAFLHGLPTAAAKAQSN